MHIVIKAPTDAKMPRHDEERQPYMGLLSISKKSVMLT